jgi:hypothetical protein
MIEEIKLMLPEGHTFTDAQIGLALKKALAEVEGYCHREIDYELEACAEEIAIIKLNRIGTEGLANIGGAMSESYIDGYPKHIQAVLDRKRKMKVL